VEVKQVANKMEFQRQELPRNRETLLEIIGEGKVQIILFCH
jgi:hypothetical protein